MVFKGVSGSKIAKPPQPPGNIIKPPLMTNFQYYFATVETFLEIVLSRFPEPCDELVALLKGATGNVW